jgi:hypothetical protein
MHADGEQEKRKFRCTTAWKRVGWVASGRKIRLASLSSEVSAAIPVRSTFRSIPPCGALMPHQRLVI